MSFNKVSAVILAGVLFGGSAVAGSRAENAYKTSKVSAQTILFSCNDEHEPKVSHLDNTTAIVITCSK